MTEKEKIRAALAYLSPDLPREDWAKIGMAIKEGLNGDGFDLFDAWSQGGQTYNANATRDTWKSINGHGRVTVATLFYLAQQNGWKPNDDSDAHPETETERIERERQRQARTEQEAAERARKQAEAAKKSVALWEAAAPISANHPYLTRKGVLPTETLREITAARATELLGYPPKSDGEPLTGRLLVAPVEIEGRISTAELIDEAGRKSAIAGGAKSGGYWTAQPLPDGEGSGLTLVIGEGVATVLSAKAASNHLAIAALSAGNLPKVARALRHRYPAARIILLADLGNGRNKAEEAAREAGAALAVPNFTGLNASKADTDFNDLHRLAGLEAVQKQVEEARFLQKLPAPTAKADENLFSDYGNIIKLLNQLNDRIAYTPGLDWLLYNPETGVWEPEPGSERVKRLVLETLRDAWVAVLYAAQTDEADLKKELKALDGEDPRAAMISKRVKLAHAHREKVFQWLRQCETAYRIRSTLELAEGYFWTAPDAWDTHPHLLVCANGVLDLYTGRLLPHSASYHATKTTGTEYRQGASHSAWNAVVSLLKAEGDRYDFVHQFCGSGLHGKNLNERVIIFQGDGGTGKGTLLTAIHRAMGDYVATVEVGSLLATDWRKQNKSAPREDLLKLRGARFVYPSIEPPKDSKLDDGSIKALTGNDAITARYPHSKNSITFMPVFKLAIQTNFPLQTEFDDPGMKRRVIVVPFNKKPERPDPTIKHDLMHDPNARAAVLAWLYEGYRVWLNNSFALPESSIAAEATAGYWADMNPYMQFAQDVGLSFGKGLKCLKPRITGAFRAWREETGRRDATLKGFPKWLKSLGCYDAQTSTLERYWHGVDFIESYPQPPQPQQPPVPVNEFVEVDYLKSIEQFRGNEGGDGCGGCGRVPDVSPTPHASPLKASLYLTPAEQKALHILRDLYQRHANHLVTGGHAGNKARVAVKDWAVALRQAGVPLEVMEKLKAAKGVHSDGTYVTLPD